VVAADHHLVLVRERAQPVNRGLDLTDGAIIGEITGMDEQVAIGYIGPFVCVGVGDANNADRLCIWRDKTRRTPKTEQQLVERIEKCD
jgi:hypothetical protein